MSDQPLTHQFNKFPSFEGKRRSEPAAFGAPQHTRRTNKTEKEKTK
jgi:hypothetical protein